MNAGEAVFQGREGTGVAQILNWQQYRPQQRQQVNPLQLQRLRMAQRAEQDKQADNFLKLGKPEQYFAVDFQKDYNNLQTEFRKALDSGMSADEAQRTFGDQKQQIELKIAKGISAADTYKRVKESLADMDNVNSKRAEEFLRDYTFVEKNEDGTIRNYDEIDENTAQQVALHPSVLDAKGAVLRLAKNVKTQLETGEIDQEVLRGNNQDFFVKENNKWRFKVDDQGRIADDVIDFYSKDDSIYDSVLWNKIAKENNVFDDDRITKEERNKIDEMFDKVRLDPKYNAPVKEEIRTWLNGIQQEVTRHTVQSAGRDKTESNFGLGFGFGSNSGDVALSDGDMVVNDPEVAKNSGLLGKKGGEISVRIPEFQKIRGIDPEAPGDEMDFLKMKINPESGKKEAVFVDKFGEEKSFEATPRILSILDNTKKSTESKKVYGEFVKRSKDLKPQDVSFDKDRFEKDTNELSDLIYKTGRAIPNKQEPQQEYVSQLQGWLEKRGIKSEISFDENWWNPDITIDGEKFDTAKPVDKKRLENLLLKKSKSYYGKTESAKGSKPQKFDPNDPL